MAMTVTSSGINVSRGRGAARISFDVSFRDLDRWARRNRVDTARLMTRSFGRAASGLKAKFFEVMKKGGGVNGVPKFRDFEDITRELRARRGRTAPMGGMLAERSSIVAFKRGGWQVIGWPDYLERTANAFQQGLGGPQAEKWFLDSDYRKIWHRTGIRYIPRAYVHNPRVILPEPFGSYVEAHLDQWAKGAFYKDLAKQMQKGAR